MRKILPFICIGNTRSKVSLIGPTFLHHRDAERSYPSSPASAKYFETETSYSSLISYRMQNSSFINPLTKQSAIACIGTISSIVKVLQVYQSARIVPANVQTHSPIDQFNICVTIIRASKVFILNMR